MKAFKCLLAILLLPYVALRRAWSVDRISTCFVVVCLILMFDSLFQELWFSAGIWFLCIWSQVCCLQADLLKRENQTLKIEILKLQILLAHYEHQEKEERASQKNPATGA